MNAAERTILIATDADEVFNDLDAALSDPRTNLIRVSSGQQVVPALAEVSPDLVILDLQIGTMGGVATCLAIRNEESFARVTNQNVMILLDRKADVFIARHADADGWLIKPLNPLRIRRGTETLISGGTYTEGVPTEAVGDTDETPGGILGDLETRDAGV